MRGNKLALIIITAIWATIPSGGRADENLKLVISKSRLPQRMEWHSAVYDGHDSIYILGGWAGDSNYVTQVSKYSLDTDRIATVGTFTPIYGGPAVMTQDGDILYYGGVISNIHHSNAVYSYSVEHGNYSVRATLPGPIRNSGLAWDSSNQVAYLFGGTFSNSTRLNAVLRHNASTSEVTRIKGTLPDRITETAAVWVPSEDGAAVAYVFGGDDGYGTYHKKVLQFVPAHDYVYTLPVPLPRYIEDACAVYVSAQDKVYVFGGTPAPLLRFDPTTETADDLEVEGLPKSLRASSCVYVPRLGRMYILGGWGSYAGEAMRLRDEIAYVELNPAETTEPPMPPSTESSICPPDGVLNLPFPGNCTMYIRCFHGQPQTLSCHPLRFDTIELICKPTEDAFCDEDFTATTVRPDLCPPAGYEVHPHESNCSKYYECNDGVAYESDCAPNTYFDIAQGIQRCNRAELAVCNAECPSTGVEFQAIRARGCKWYKVCLVGSSANLECEEGTLYHPQPQRCVPEEEYSCPFVFTA